MRPTTPRSTLSHPFNPLLYVSPYGGLSAIKLNTDHSPLEDLLVRKALAHSLDMEEVVTTLWGPAAVHAKGLISRHVPCHNPAADYQPYDPDLARQALAMSTYGSVDNLPPLMIDLIRPDEVDMGRLIRAYWKDNLGVDLEVRERNDPLGQRRLGFVSGVDLEAHELYTKPRDYVQFHHITVESWTPDPAQIVSSLPPLDFLYRIIYPHSNIAAGYPVMLALFQWANFAASRPSRAVRSLPGVRVRVSRPSLHHPNQRSRPRQVARPALARRLREHLQPGLQHPHVRIRRQALSACRPPSRN